MNTQLLAYNNRSCSAAWLEMDRKVCPTATTYSLHVTSNTLRAEPIENALMVDPIKGKSKWTKGSILTKIIGTYMSDMPSNSAGNYVTVHEFPHLICNGVK